MRKIHDGQGSRIQVGKIFTWMALKIAKDLNAGILSSDMNITDLFRWGLVLVWKRMNEKGYNGYDKIPQAALDMLKERIEDIDL